MTTTTTTMLSSSFLSDDTFTSREIGSGNGSGGDDHPNPPPSGLLSSNDNVNPNTGYRDDDTQQHQVYPSTSTPSSYTSPTSTTSGFDYLCSIRRFFVRTKELYTQLSIQEISGSFGDMGTFIPLFVAMGRQRAIYVTPALFCAGLANAVTGYVWDLPMPVQPMKAICAIALVDQLSRPQVTTAGICMGIMLVLLGATNGINWVNRIIPTSIVSGMQIGVGSSLAIHGIDMIASQLNWADKPDCIVLAIMCSCVCLYLLREDNNNSERTTDAGEGETDATHSMISFIQIRRLIRHNKPPVGIILFLLGATLAILDMITAKPNTTLSALRSDDSDDTSNYVVFVSALKNVSWEDWKIGFFEGALPQLPLSTLNSVISVCCLANSLYPEKRKASNRDSTCDGAGATEDVSTNRNNATNEDGSDGSVLSRREVCTAVGLMNLVLCPFGAMPNCHGAGGLAGQHKFGARHGASVVFLGASKMILAVIFGGSILTFLDRIPIAILGVMLAISGHALALTGFTFLVHESHVESEVVAGVDTNMQQLARRNKNGTIQQVLRTNATVALLTALIILALKKTHYGALGGLVAHALYGNGVVGCGQWFKGIISSRSPWVRTRRDPSSSSNIGYAQVRPRSPSCTDDDV